MSDYEHSGTWTCEICESEEEIESKIDVLGFALSHECGEKNDEN